MAERIARWLAHPITIVGLAALFAVLPALMPVDVITYILSVMALTICQLVLLAQFNDKARDQHRDDAMHQKLDQIILALDKAPNEYVGIEKREPS